MELSARVYDNLNKKLIKSLQNTVADLLHLLSPMLVNFALVETHQL